MSKTDTWMPFYIGDYLADTMHLTAQQHGCYMLMLMHQWRTGPLIDDDMQLAAIARVDLATWRKAIAPVVRRFFVVTPSGLSQKRLAAERAKSSNNSAKRAEAGRAGAAKRWNDDDDEGGQGESEPKPNGGGGGSQTDGNCHASAIKTPMADAIQNDGTLPSPSQLNQERKPLASQARPTADAENAVLAWNAMADRHGLAKVARLTDERRRHLNRRLVECGGIDGWHDAMRLVSESPFLLGEVRDWKADFDFVLQQSSFTKLMEGSYGNRGKQGHARTAADVLGVSPGPDWDHHPNLLGIPS